MENRGVGRVVDVNRELEGLKVDFDGFPGLSVGFRAAAKLLKPLPPGHILRRTLEEPDAVRELAASDPPELLRQVLTSYGEPMKAAEVRQAVAAVVSEKKWTSWWTAARKHPQVVARGAGARQTYTWADSSDDALEAVWQTFEKADPLRRIELLRRDGGRDPKLRRRMAEALGQTAQRAAAEEPGLAFEIWFALERTGGAPEEVPWSPDALLDQPSPERLFAGIRDRLLRERAYTMYRERHDDWPEIYLEALDREEDPRVLDLLADGLRDGDPKALERFLDSLLTQPQRSPAAFVWMAERSAVDESFLTRNPMRLLQHILQGPGRDELKPHRVRLLAQVDSGGTVPRLLSHLSEDQARQAEEAIHRAAFLEGYQREQLVTALHLRFPELDKRREMPLYALPASIDAKRAELKKLATQELPANRKAIEEARALGDLRENFEYKSARQRHEYLSARAHQLEGELRRVQPIASEIDTSEVRIGTRLQLEGDDGAPRSLAILGPWESDPEADIISYESELAQELLGKKPGDRVEVAGEGYTLAGIEMWEG
jgi:transcription elongation GreA/GreB family factor